MDVGANIGYMTSILAVSVAPGEVQAFEPHPALFERLAANCRAWQHVAAPVRPLQAAVSSRDGTCTLAVPPGFSSNAGIASIGEPADAGDAIEVRAVTLDTVVGARGVGVLKLDVEGHEPAVLEGGERVLTKHAIRDVVFEDHHGYPSESASILESHGYRVYRDRAGRSRPNAVPPAVARTSVHGAPQNYVATVQPARLEERIRPRGWHVLRPRSRGHSVCSPEPPPASFAQPS